MNSGPLLFLGLFFALASSFWGLILVPQMKLGRQEVVNIASTGELYPAGRPGLARQGAEVYRSLGCGECHSQQVRARGFGTDFARGWGLRFSVAQDYLRDNPVQLGNLRVGPDLTNIGQRQTNATWHYVHLYHPQKTTPGSMMPPYRFLFEQRPLVRGRGASPDALPVNDPQKDGFEIIPTDDARALVAYLLNLQATVPLFEAPLPRPATNATVAATNVTESASTNAAAADTNAAPPVDAKEAGAATTNSPSNPTP